MSKSAIHISNLCFGYNQKDQILSELNLSVPTGSIYGFLGKNGAGKSTTMRAILGLLKPQQGQISILGSGSVAKEPHLYHRMGSLIEAPSLYHHLSAGQNLKVACRLRGLDSNQIKPTLEKVGLSHTKGKKVKAFSMGMKQRLGLAMALVHDPKLLILDEPTNGLDPQGMREIREIMNQLSEQGKTIMISSHLLSEIEKIATNIGMLHNGKLVFEGTMDELEELKAKESIVRLKLSNIEKAEKILGTVASRIDSNHLKVKGSGKKFIPSLIRDLAVNGIDIYEVIEEKPDLEQLFMHITT